MRIVLVSMSLVILTAYIVIFVSFHGIPPSLSESYYHIKHKALFSLTLVMSGGLIIIPWIELSQRAEGLAFLSVAALMFVAASPQFKESLSREVHYVSAGIMAVASISWELLNWGLWLPLVAFLIIGICNRRNIVFWVEVGLMLDVCSSLIAYLL